MHQLLRHQFWIAIAAVVIFFTNLGAARLWDDDEGIYASCAREMFQRGDWVVPRYNGEIFFDKPPLMFWLMIGGFELFGVTEFAARFFSAVLGVGTGLVTYHLGRLLFRAEVGFWAGLIVVSNLIFTVSARAATVDSALTFVTTLIVLLFVLARRDEKAWLLWAAVYACTGVAILAKGPVGMLLPAATIGLFLLVMHRPLAPRNVLWAVWTMRPLTAAVVIAGVALPWYVLVGLRTDGAWLEQFFAKYNVGPFLNPSLGHRGPFFYHFLAVLIGFFPWAVFLGPALLDALRQVRNGHAWRPGYILLWCWVGVFFVFWSACSTKLPHYVLPAYPALALLTGCFVHDWLAEPAAMGRRWPRHVAAVLVFVGVGIAVAIPIVAAYFVPGEGLVGLVGLVLVAGGGVYRFYEKLAQPRRMLAAFAATAVVFLTGVFGLAAVRIDRHQHSEPLVEQIRAQSQDRPQMAGYRFLQGSIVFYAGEPLPCFEDAAHLRRFLAASPQPYVFTTSEHEAEIERQFPGEFRVVARRPRFLRRNEDVLVLAGREDRERAKVAGRAPQGGRQ